MSVCESNQGWNRFSDPSLYSRYAGILLDSSRSTDSLGLVPYEIYVNVVKRSVKKGSFGEDMKSHLQIEKCEEKTWIILCGSTCKRSTCTN